MGSPLTKEQMEDFEETLKYLEAELKFSKLQRHILINEEKYWADEKLFQSLIRRKVFFVVHGTWEAAQFFDCFAAYK